MPSVETDSNRFGVDENHMRARARISFNQQFQSKSTEKEKFWIVIIETSISESYSRLGASYFHFPIQNDADMDFGRCQYHYCSRLKKEHDQYGSIMEIFNIHSLIEFILQAHAS